MFNHIRFIKLIMKQEQLLRRHWLVALCVAGFVGVLWIGAPAWAAPVAAPLSQLGGTVPRPTATPVAGPVATATPRPDGGESGGNRDTGGDNGSTAPADAPNIVFPQQPGGSPSTGSPAALTAQVTVNALNLREGPDTSFNTLGSLPVNSQVSVLARSEDGAWWYVCCLPGTQTTGWVSAQLLTPDFDRAQANTLIPVFGSTPAAPAAGSTPPQATTEPMAQAKQPLEVDFGIFPYFVWQGITATLTITVNNPNAVDAVNVVLSDELPEALAFVEADADAGGTVETVTTENGRTLLLFTWATIPADTAVGATIVAQVSPEIADGAVIDNLVALRGRNVGYSTDVLTIGMPPVLQPDFQ
ncbi:MAG: SH3 domain-containing protein [Caldilineaceae bacterium]|nr:SH3 domain-containing protein [Caldilineaceae bacterium]